MFTFLFTEAENCKSLLYEQNLKAGEVPPLFSKGGSGNVRELFVERAHLCMVKVGCSCRRKD